MQKGVSFVLVAFLSLLLSACPASEPPITGEPPEEEPAEFEVSGTLVGWTEGEAYITLTGGYASSSGDPETDGVQLSEPTYGSTLSSDGSFSVTLTEPNQAELLQLTCEDGVHPIGFLLLGVVSSVPEPTENEEVLGDSPYTLGPPNSLVENAAWLYSEEALELDGACSLDGSVAEVDLDLAPGWNTAILTVGSQVRLESSEIPETFVWSQF
jgi:hypothetical protein